MAPGFRYHVITIVAIFMALGVGMVVGSSHLQEALVERLQVQLAALGRRFTDEIEPLRQRTEEQKRLLNLLATRLTHNRLTDRRVAVVVTGDYGDAAHRATDELRSAGAEIVSLTTIPSTFPDRLDAVRARLTQVLPEIAASADDPRSGVLRLLSRRIVYGGSRSDLTELVDANLIETDGNYNRPVHLVILFGGANAAMGKRWSSVDLPLIDGLLETGARVIGAEAEAADVSYITAYQSKGISTVDNVDTEIGQTTLVLLASGDRGSYGIKDTARDGLLPSGERQE